MIKSKNKSLNVLCIILLFVILVFGIFIMSACNEETYTEQEIILETKKQLKNQYNLTTLYNTEDLPTNFLYDNKYKTYIEWESTDNSIVDITTRQINRTLENQNCKLTATIYYKNTSGNLELNFIIPPNLYKPSKINYYTSYEIGIGINELYYFEEDSKTNLSASIAILNDKKEDTPFKGIYFEFSIFDQNNNQITNKIKTSLDWKTHINYGEYRINTIIINNNDIIEFAELANQDFHITATIFHYTI